MIQIIKENLLIILFALLAIAALVGVIHPDLRVQIRNAIQPNSRVVLATLQIKNPDTNEPLTILKVKEANNLLLEFYKNEAQSPQLIQRFELGQLWDTYYFHHGKQTQLWAQDMDNDEHQEIAVPFMDKNWIGQVAIFKFTGQGQTIRVVGNF